ncbi:MAG TPA: choice-of-anchor D domain-containing protein [archaeon]|nr:choice-of-anchor D domain-containing protein [archaeon]
MLSKQKIIGRFFLLPAGIIIHFSFCSRNLPVTPEPSGPFYYISGQITTQGSPKANVDVSLAGEKDATTRTDSLGHYKFIDLSTGIYSVKPRKSGYSFNPQEIQLEIADTNLIDQNFTMVPQSASILPLKTELDFGIVHLKQTGTIVLGLSNLGKTTLLISKFDFTSSAFSAKVNSENIPADSLKSSAVMVISPESLAYLSVLFTPVDTGKVTAQMTIKSNDLNTPETQIKLSGTGIDTTTKTALIAVQPLALNFDTVLAGSSKVLSVAITNQGNDTLHLDSVTTSNAVFKLSVPTYVLAPGQRNEITVTFSPTDISSITAQLRIVSDAVNTPILVVNLKGNGLREKIPVIQAVPSSFDFGTVIKDSIYTQGIEIRNSGTDTLFLTGVRFSIAGFSSTFSGQELIAPGQKKNYTITLQTATLGSLEGTLTIYNNDPSRSELKIPLKAQVRELPPRKIRLNPTVLSFGEVIIGMNLTKIVWVVNPNQVILKVKSVTTSDQNFIAGTDSLSIAPSDSGFINVVFAPIGQDPVNALLIIGTNVEGKDTVSVALSGKGVQSPNPVFEFSPSTLDFGSLVVGDQSSLIVTIRNNGEGPLVISKVETDAPVFSIQISPFVLEAGASRNNEVSFKPIKTGIVRGTLIFHSNDPQMPESRIALRGSGVDTTSIAPLMRLSKKSIDFGETVEMLSSSTTLLVDNIGKDTLHVSDIRSSQPEFSALPVQFALAPRQTQTISLFFNPLNVGEISGTLVVFSDNLISAQDTIEVKGVGVSSSSVITEKEVFIPGGTFLMGQPGEAEPVRLVTLSSFYIDAVEVTNEEYKEFIDAGGYDRRELWTADGWNWRTTNRELDFRPEDPKPRYWGSGSAPWESDQYSRQPNTPVVGISWYEAYAYAKFRKKALPTEAQWEYTVRGTEGRIYPWGVTWIELYCNHGKSRSPYYDEIDGFKYTAPIGTYTEGATPEGVYNLAGNVSEWCADWFSLTYDGQDRLNPKGPSSGSEKVIRGGSWQGAIVFCRSFNRNKSQPTIRYMDVGIRLVRNF